MAEIAGFSLPGEFDLLRDQAASVDGPYMEIGTYCGRSTVHLADAARLRDTVVFAVDHHRGSPEMQPGQACHDPAMIGPDGRHDSLPHLRRNLADCGVEQFVIPVVCDARVLGPFWRTPLGFLFIDGGHDPDNALADFTDFGAWLRPDGLLAFHDTTDTYGPGHALARAEEAGWERVAEHETLVVLRGGSR